MAAEFQVTAGPRGLALLAVCLIALFAAPAVPVAGAAGGDLSEVLTGLCAAPQSFGYIFSSPNQVLELIELWDQQGATLCPQNDGRGLQLEGPLGELKALLQDDTLMGDVCSAHAYERIRHFHLRFIHYYKPELSRNELLQLDELDSKGQLRGGHTSGQQPQLPVALRRFFILFVKQINSLCKQQIQPKLKELVEERALIDSDEFALIERYKKESPRLFPLLSAGLTSIKGPKGKKFKELEVFNFSLYDEEKSQYPYSLLAANSTTSLVATGESDVGSQTTGDAGGSSSSSTATSSDDDDDDGTKLYVKVRFNDRLKRLHDACKMKFKPIYDEVFTPVIRLNNLAYVDNLKTKHEDHELEWNEDLAKWFQIIEACETMKDVEVLHDSSEISALANLIEDRAPRQTGEDRSKLNQVTLLSPEEARQFKAQLARKDKLIAYDPDLVKFEHNRVRFTPRMWLQEEQEVGGEIKAYERDLKKLVSRRKSYLRLLKNDVSFVIKSFYYKHKKDIQDRDAGSSLGRLTAFCERHKISIKVAMILISCMFIAMHFG